MPYVKQVEPGVWLWKETRTGRMLYCADGVNDREFTTRKAAREAYLADCRRRAQQEDEEIVARFEDGHVVGLYSPDQDGPVTAIYAGGILGTWPSRSDFRRQAIDWHDALPEGLDSVWLPKGYRLAELVSA